MQPRTPRRRARKKREMGGERAAMWQPYRCHRSLLSTKEAQSNGQKIAYQGTNQCNLWNLCCLFAVPEFEYTAAAAVVVVLAVAHLSWDWLEAL